MLFVGVSGLAEFAVHVGDCVPLLAAMPDASVDCIVTDIPYNTINRESAGLRSFDKGEADSAPVSLRWVAREFSRLSRGSVYVWCAQEQLSTLLRAFQRLGLSTRSGVWWKNDPPVANGEYLWTSAIEVCCFARQPKAPFFRHCKPPVWRGPIERNIEWHPTPKPVWLMRELVTASCPPGGSVLDPFMGSGSVGVAALEEGRTFTGIEQNAEWAERARQRLAPILPSLFSVG